jgi:hypothetical protein
MPRSRRKNERVTKTGISITESWCRHCMKMRPSRDFYEAVDGGLVDKNGLFSICKDSINELFDTLLASEKSYEKSTLKLCRILNLRYEESAVQAALKQLETYKERGTEGKFFGSYKSKLHAVLKTTQRMESGIDLQYTEVTSINITGTNTLNDFNESEIERDVIAFWGDGYETEDYEWLEKTLADWKRTHKSDTMAEETLLKEIVFKQFEIRKSRKDGTSTAALVKELQDLMKTASVDPAKTSLANSGRAQDTFSSFIRMIEENEPASYYSQEDKKLFKDFDNIEYYFDKYIRRPLRNFVSGSRDFNVDSESDEDDELGENADIDSAEMGE